MKTAVIVAGVCRFTNISHSSWNIFPDADWYLSTWDITQKPYSPEAHPSSDEIDAIKDKFKHIEVLNYKEKYLDIPRLSAELRPFILLEHILNIIKEQQYERVVYFRPDLVLFKMNDDLFPDLMQLTADDFNENDYNVDDSTIKIAGDHTPDCWIDHSRQILHDNFFVFSWNTFVKFIEDKKEITKHPDIHYSLYNYFAKNNINVEPLHPIRTAILRSNIVDNEDKKTWKDLTTLFVNEYNEKNHIGKFTHIIELTIPSKPDYAKIEESELNGGILKLRNK